VFIRDVVFGSVKVVFFLLNAAEQPNAHVGKQAELEAAAQDGRLATVFPDTLQSNSGLEINGQPVTVSPRPPGDSDDKDRLLPQQAEILVIAAGIFFFIVCTAFIVWRCRQTDPKRFESLLSCACCKCKCCDEPPKQEEPRPSWGGPPEEQAGVSTGTLAPVPWHQRTSVDLVMPLEDGSYGSPVAARQNSQLLSPEHVNVGISSPSQLNKLQQHSQLENQLASEQLDIAGMSPMVPNHYAESPPTGQVESPLTDPWMVPSRSNSMPSLMAPVGSPMGVPVLRHQSSMEIGRRAQPQPRLPAIGELQEQVVHLQAQLDEMRHEEGAALAGGVHRPPGRPVYPPGVLLFESEDRDSMPVEKSSDNTTPTHHNFGRRTKRRPPHIQSASEDLSAALQHADHAPWPVGAANELYLDQPMSGWSPRRLRKSRSQSGGGSLVADPSENHAQWSFAAPRNTRDASTEMSRAGSQVNASKVEGRKGTPGTSIVHGQRKGSRVSLTVDVERDEESKTGSKVAGGGHVHWSDAQAAKLHATRGAKQRSRLDVDSQASKHSRDSKALGGAGMSATGMSAVVSVPGDSKTVTPHPPTDKPRTQVSVVSATSTMMANNYGIGASFKVARDKDPVVNKVVRDSPADREGIQVGDVLMQVRQLPSQPVPPSFFTWGRQIGDFVCRGARVSELLRHLVGPEGTKVDLAIQRPFDPAVPRDPDHSSPIPGSNVSSQRTTSPKYEMMHFAVVRSQTMEDAQTTITM